MQSAVCSRTLTYTSFLSHLFTADKRPIREAGNHFGGLLDSIWDLKITEKFRAYSGCQIGGCQFEDASMLTLTHGLAKNDLLPQLHCYIVFCLTEVSLHPKTMVLQIAAFGNCPGFLLNIHNVLFSLYLCVMMNKCAVGV